MAIDLENESPIPLSQVPREIPSSRPGRKLHISTVWRWATSGVNGVRLETVSIGRSRYTTRRALSEFIARCSERPGDAPVTRTPRQRERDKARAARVLDEAGIC